MFASERDKNELPDTIMAFHNDSFQILKSHCLLESSVPLPWQPNLIKTLATGAFRKLMIQAREPIPHTLSLILLAYHRYGISNMVYMLQIFHFLPIILQ